MCPVGWSQVSSAGTQLCVYLPACVPCVYMAFKIFIYFYFFAGTGSLLLSVGFL